MKRGDWKRQRLEVTVTRGELRALRQVARARGLDAGSFLVESGLCAVAETRRATLPEKSPSNPRHERPLALEGRYAVSRERS